MDISCTAINMLLFLLGGYLFKATTPNSQKASHMLFSKFLFCLIITLSLELKRKRGKEGDPPLTTSTISCPLAVMILVFCLWYQWPLITWDGFTLWRQHGRSLWFILILASFTTEDPPPQSGSHVLLLSLPAITPSNLFSGLLFDHTEFSFKLSESDSELTGRLVFLSSLTQKHCSFYQV